MQSFGCAESQDQAHPGPEPPAAQLFRRTQAVHIRCTAPRTYNAILHAFTGEMWTYAMCMGVLCHSLDDGPRPVVARQLESRNWRLPTFAGAVRHHSGGRIASEGLASCSVRAGHPKGRAPTGISGRPLRCPLPARWKRTGQGLPPYCCKTAAIVLLPGQSKKFSSAL